MAMNLNETRANSGAARQLNGTLGGGGQPSPSQARPGVVVVILAAGVLTLLLVMFLSTRPKAISPAPVPANTPDAPAVSPRPTFIAPSPRAQPARSSTSAPRAVALPPPVPEPAMQDRWGIEITSLGMAMGGKALDLRYKVLDLAKATSMQFLTNYVYVVNQSSGNVLIVPFQQENQTKQKLAEGKVFFALLPNKEGRVQSGSVVTVVVGNSRQENIVVR